MRYLGCKTKLLSFITSTIEKYGINGKTFCDLFAGTASVSDYLKDQYEIIANDFMFYSFVFCKAKIENSHIPTFNGFRKKYKTKDIFQWLNKKNYTPNRKYFIYNNYSPKGNRKFYLESNALAIDGIRDEIEKLKIEGTLLENEYYFLLASLLDSASRFSNTSGTFEAFFKFWDARALKKFVIEPIELNCVKNLQSSQIYNEQSNELIRKISGDILYIDPPYTVTQYASAYNILETIALQDEPEIKGVGGKRNKGKCVSNYCYAKYAKAEFEDLFRQAQFKHILISYSNQGVVPLEDMVAIAKKFAKNKNVFVEYMPYQEYKNHRSSNKHDSGNLNEVLIYFEKDLSVIKSPLNYSGSKDQIYTQLQKFFPKHIGTFVDVMGGAFNVGVNTHAMDKVIYNDINEHIVSIIKWLLTTPKNSQITEVENIINKYKMGKGSKIPYMNLRNDYNKKPSISSLFVLHLYSFQNYIRFNGKQEFNTPIGIAGYSSALRQRILNFTPQTQCFSIMNADFEKIDWDTFPTDSLFYFDPPYLITKAAYNDGKRGGKGWNLHYEQKLLNVLEFLDKRKYKFILSNVISHKGKENTTLIKWANDNNFFIHEIGKSGYRFSKKEIVITNYQE